MKRIPTLALGLLVLAMLALGAASAQQNATLSGIIKSEADLPEGTRVAVHVVDNDNVWGHEVASVVPLTGTFSVTADPLPEAELKPFRSGAVLLPGLQNEYQVTPDDVNYARGRVNMYVDNNDNEVFDRLTDTFFLGVATLERPSGYFTLLYVDKDATLSGTGAELQLKRGWNIFSVRFPEEGTAYAVQPLVEDAVLDVFLP